MNSQITLEFCECACGCGLEATQLYRGVPIPDTNPMTHYRRYIAREDEQQRSLREAMIMGSQARKFILLDARETEIKYGDS